MFNYLIYRIGQFIALHLPLKIGYKIAVFLSDLRYLFAYQDRRQVRENLKVIFPEKTDSEICSLRLAISRNFAKYLVDFFRFAKIDRDYIRKNIRVENQHYLDAGLSKGKGVVVLTAHIGNWELGGVMIALLGYPFWVVALPHKHKKVDDFFNRQRQSKGVNVIPLGKAMRLCLKVLTENKLLALVGDRDFTQKGVVLDFFGKPTLFPVGPAAFVLKTEASLVPGFMVRNPDDSFTLRFERTIDFIPSGNKEQDTLDLIKKYKGIIEDYIRKYPDQWYMFRRFWIE